MFWKFEFFHSLAFLIFFMAYISKRHPDTAWIIQVCQIKFSGYGGYNIPHVNNFNFSENKFALLFQQTIENKFWRQKQHSMKEKSIHNEWIKLVFKSKCIDDFQIKSYKSNSAVPLWPVCVLWKSKKAMFNFMPKFSNFQNIKTKNEIRLSNLQSVKYCQQWVRKLEMVVKVCLSDCQLQGRPQLKTIRP